MLFVYEPQLKVTSSALDSDLLSHSLTLAPKAMLSLMNLGYYHGSAKETCF